MRILPRVQKKRGRPTKYKPEYAERAEAACLTGATNEELAERFGCDKFTIDTWIRTHADFSGALKRGREDADNNVTKSLYQRAIGYSCPDVQIMQYQGSPVVVPYTKHYPPSEVACIFWLKNRQPRKWRDHPLEVSPEDAAAIAQEFAAVMASAGAGVVTRGNNTLPTSAGAVQDSSRGSALVQDGDSKTDVDSGRDAKH